VALFFIGLLLFAIGCAIIWSHTRVDNKAGREGWDPVHSPDRSHRTSYRTGVVIALLGTVLAIVGISSGSGDGSCDSGGRCLRMP